MFYSSKVGIPDVQGRIIRRKRGLGIHVEYMYENNYVKEKKYSIPKRAVIGKICEDDDTKMHPNENFFRYFPDEDRPLEKAPGRSCCLRIGPYVIIRKILDEYGLDTKIGKVFGDDTGLLLDLASYWIIEENNASQYYPDYAYDHPLFTKDMRICSDSSVSRFFSSLSQESIQEFLKDWNKGRDHRQRIYISYDATNKNGQAGDIDLLEFGHAKDDDSRPVFNLAVAYDTTNSIPLFYEEYPGSINDMAQFTYFMNKMKAYGYRHIGFILDRGYFSTDNIRYMDDGGYQFIMMIKGMKSLVNGLVMSVRDTFENDPDHRISRYNVYATTVKSPLFKGDGKQRWMHVCYNSHRAARERDRFEAKMDELEAGLRKTEGMKVEFPPRCAQRTYFDLYFDNDGTFLFARKKKEAIMAELECCGYFVIVSSEEMSAEEAVGRYKGRDASEKLFRSDKTFLGGRSMRVYSRPSMQAKTFVEFTALIIRCRIYTLLKDKVEKLKIRRNYMNVPAAIKELEKIEMKKEGDGVYRLDHAVTKTQRIILSSFGIDEKYVIKVADDISATISAAAETDAGDEEEGSEVDYEVEDDYFC